MADVSDAAILIAPSAVTVAPSSTRADVVLSISFSVPVAATPTLAAPAPPTAMAWMVALEAAVMSSVESPSSGAPPTYASTRLSVVFHANEAPKPALPVAMPTPPVMDWMSEVSAAEMVIAPSAVLPAAVFLPLR